MSGPTVATIKKLFVLSGNKCAFPECKEQLVDEISGKVTGRICHIKARSEKGPRYDKSQTDEERHSFNNLVLMCPIHHDVIDSDIETYTIEKLMEIKIEYENSISNVSEINDSIANKFIISSENTQGSVVIGKNLGQSAYSITNNYANSENKNIKAYSRMLKENIERLLEICIYQSKQDFSYNLDELPLKNWKEYFFAVSDSLNEFESKQLIRFYDIIDEFEKYKVKAKETIQKLGIRHDLPYCHVSTNKVFQNCHAYLNEILQIDLSKVLEKLSKIGR